MYVYLIRRRRRGGHKFDHRRLSHTPSSSRGDQDPSRRRSCRCYVLLPLLQRAKLRDSERLKCSDFKRRKEGHHDQTRDRKRRVFPARRTGCRASQLLQELHRLTRPVHWLSLCFFCYFTLKNIHCSTIKSLQKTNLTLSFQALTSPHPELVE